MKIHSLYATFVMILVVGCAGRGAPLTENQKRNPNYYDPPYSNLALGMTTEEMERTVGRKPEFSKDGEDGVTYFGYETEKKDGRLPRFYKVGTKGNRIISIFRIDGTLAAHRNGARIMDADIPSK